MTRVLVPYHLDEYLPDLDIPVTATMSITVDLPTGDTWRRMGHLYESVATAISDLVTGTANTGTANTGTAKAGTAAAGTAEAGRDCPVVLSGDCTTSLGVVAGLQRAGIDPAIVWFDAHGDVQTLETTASGYLGGMPLRILAGYRPELIAGALGLRPVPESRILLVDARDLDPPEADYLARSVIQHRPVAEVSADTLPDGPLYLHVDFDVVDPDDLPGLLFPAPGGPGLGEVTAALHRIIATGRVAALGLACTWRPGPGGADPVRQPVADLLATAG